ncbi:MAG: PIN domain-containing protein [Micrococcales bacterium]|nr:PIN domain-containing protein [Micrococcales bacterium]
MTLWHIDTNILISVATRRSPAASDWYDQLLARGDTLVASRFMEVEARHLVTNHGGDASILDDYLRDFHIQEVDPRLMHEAIAVPGVISGADAVHLAAALRIRSDTPVIVTHDRQYARAATALAFAVHDPVTDDPDRPAVASR